MTWATNRWLPSSVSSARHRSSLPSHTRISRTSSPREIWPINQAWSPISNTCRWTPLNRLRKVTADGHHLNSRPSTSTWFSASWCSLVKATRSRQQLLALRMPPSTVAAGGTADTHPSAVVTFRDRLQQTDQVSRCPRIDSSRAGIGHR